MINKKQKYPKDWRYWQPFMIGILLGILINSLNLDFKLKVLITGFLIIIAILYEDKFEGKK